MSFKPQCIRDPLHNLIEFKANEFEDVLWKVIQTYPFQRLRRIKQLGFSDFVYPGATHSRFAHSLGVFHTARKLMGIIEKHLGTTNYKVSKAHAALAASLVHDLGHGPFSHAFEEVGKRLNIKMADHVKVSERLIKDSEISSVLNQISSGFAVDVANIIDAGPSTIYGAVVSSQFDADRLDYMRRDRLMTGTQHSAIDFDWLVANLQIGHVLSGVDNVQLKPQETFVLGPKAIYAAEAYLIGLFQLYPTVYFHKATRCAEKILTELVAKIITLSQNNSVAKTGLSDNHPLVLFAKNPDDIERVLALDDTVIWGALPMLADAQDSTVSDLAKRLWKRKLYKCIDIRAELGNKDEDALTKSRASIQEKIQAWISIDNRNHRILIDQATREPYKRLEESDGPLNQIQIMTSDGRQIDICECSPIIKAISPFKLFRAYFDANDSEAREFIEKTIEEEKNNGNKE